MSITILSVMKRSSVLGSLLIFAIAGAIKWQATWMPESTFVPVDPEPQVNARTYFDIASREVDKNLGSLIPDQSRQPNSTPSDWNNPNSGNFSPDFAVKDQMVRRSLPAFAELEAGLKYTYEPIPVRSIYGTMTYLASYRNLARCLRYAADCAEEHGNWADAIRYRLDCIDLGVHIAHGSTLIGGLVGIACQSIGRRDADKIVDHLSLQESIVAEKRLLQIDDRQVPISSILMEEKWTMQGSLLSLFKGRNFRVALLDGSALNRFTLNWLVTTFESPRLVYDRYTNYMNACIARASQPWPKQAISDPVPYDHAGLCSQIEPIYEQGTFKLNTVIAFNRLIEAEIALHIYELQHHTYPPTLNQLVPSILPSMPVDPFSANQALRYKLLKNGNYLLYSIGPDAIDNGGVPLVYDLGQQPAMELNNPDHYAVKDQTSKGDIVAGISD